MNDEIDYVNLIYLIIFSRILMTYDHLIPMIVTYLVHLTITI